MLPNLLRVGFDQPDNLESEDLYSASLSTLFPDDCQVQHGDAQSRLIYSSVFSELEFRCADVNGEEERSKFAHYLWNSGILMGELVGGPHDNAKRDEQMKQWWISPHEEAFWSVKGECVLELGAGVGLAGIVSVLAGAQEVAITDYPSDVLMQTIKLNVVKNIPAQLLSNVTVQPHLWGDICSSWAMAHKHHFTRILAADTLWLVCQHENLARSMAHFLARDARARVLLIAGFHTGRSKVAQFLEIIGRESLEVEQIYEMNVEGQTRDWHKDRADTATESKRWLIVARLKWEQDEIN